MNFAIFWRNFDEFNAGIKKRNKNFARISQKWTGNDKMSRDFKKKCQKNLKNYY
jgi:hypothetical protein